MTNYCNYDVYKYYYEVLCAHFPKILNSIASANEHATVYCMKKHAIKNIQ